MAKLHQVCCPKCNNKTDFYRYGKDAHGHQKYQCKKCWHQWAPETPERVYTRTKNYPACPVCGKATFLHHDREHYTHYTCSDKKCRHSVFVPKPTAISAPSMSKLFGKTDFKRMRYPVHVILMALSMFYLGKNSFRNIALILRTVMNVRVSHTTISNWCTNFAPMFQNMAIQLIPALNFNSDEWHADETVVKILGEKYYLWLILDSETRFVLGFHLLHQGVAGPCAECLFAGFTSGAYKGKFHGVLAVLKSAKLLKNDGTAEEKWNYDETSHIYSGCTS